MIRYIQRLWGILIHIVDTYFNINRMLQQQQQQQRRQQIARVLHSMQCIEEERQKKMYTLIELISNEKENRKIPKRQKL